MHLACTFVGSSSNHCKRGTELSFGSRKKNTSVWATSLPLRRGLLIPRHGRHLISRDRLILCYTASGPAYGTVDDLLSMAVTGKPGRGKTTALMYYVTILLSIGAEVIIWDPHGAMGELALLNGKRLSGLPATARVIYLDRKEEIIDSIAARTSTWPWSRSTRRANPARPSPSGAATPTSTRSPLSASRQ